MVSFINSFLSYLLCMAVFVAVALIAVFIGIKARKAKDAKIMQSVDTQEKAEE